MTEGRTSGRSWPRFFPRSGDVNVPVPRTYRWGSSFFGDHRQQRQVLHAQLEREKFDELFAAMEGYAALRKRARRAKEQQEELLRRIDHKADQKYARDVLKRMLTVLHRPDSTGQCEVCEIPWEECYVVDFMMDHYE